MSSSPAQAFSPPAHVVVVGGGLAGLTAACDLVDAGLRVTLLEDRRRLGGATFSFQRDGLTIDNGQHVLLRCCTSYRTLLDRLGTSTGIQIQKFHLPVLAADGRRTALFRTGGRAPLHLVAGLSRYAALPAADRMRVLRAATALRRLDPEDPALDEHSFGDWLARHGQNKTALKALWNLITVAALNAEAEQASLGLAAMVFRTALLDRADAADIGIPRLPLDDLHIRSAEKYLVSRGAEVRTRSPVRGIDVDSGHFVLHLDEGPMDADAVVVAVPPEAAARLCPPQAGLDPRQLAGLGTAPIVNVHVIYERPVTDLSFAAAVSSPVQWIFDRTAVAGLSRGQYVSVSLSAADLWFDKPVRRLRELFLPELGRLLPRAAQTPVNDFFVTRERRATFRQRPGSARFRPEPGTGIPGLVLAGAWTATGWPDTMEGAVRSGHRAAEMVTAQVMGGMHR